MYLKKYRLQVVVYLFFIVILVLAQNISQPIQYNHKIHIDEAGLECTDCHQNAASNTRALIPNINICADCHEDDDSENKNIAKVADFIEKSAKIPWRQIHNVPDYVFFSHRRHVTLAELECSSCHGEVAAMERPFSEPAILITMEWCMNCHEEQKVSNDCYACHR